MTKAFCVFLMVFTLGGCPATTPPPQPVSVATQAKIASAIAVTVNETVPLLRDAESQEGDDIIHTSTDDVSAHMRLAALEERWKPIWEAEKALRLAQNVWATTLEKGGDKDAAAKAVLATFCRFAPLLPRSMPRLSLATYLCEVQP
jgi:hypothetical protein